MIHNKCQIEQNNGVLITIMLKKSQKEGNSNDSDESRNINNWYQSSLYIYTVITLTGQLHQKFMVMLIH